MVAPLRVGDMARLKKPHPCGSVLWRVYRVGADIGLRCQGCGRRVLLARSRLERQLRQVHPATAEGPSPGPSSIDTP